MGGQGYIKRPAGCFLQAFFLDAGRAIMISALSVDVMEPPKLSKDLQMTGKLETALGRRRLKHLLPVLEKHGVTDWTVGEVTDDGLRGFGIDDEGVRRRILKGFESVAKIKPPPGTMVDVEGGTQTWSASWLKGMPVENFQIGVYLVTHREWERVRNWALENGFEMNPGSGGGPMYPVVEICWYDALKWCNAKSLMEGLEPVYAIQGEAGCFSKGEFGPKVPDKIVWQRGADGYRLPSEPEWEWAACGGSRQECYLYSGSNSLDRVGWWYGDKTEKIGCHPVGGKKPNGLGIYDMSGNAREMCWLSHDSKLRDRGGSWFDYCWDCRIFDRANDPHANGGNDETSFRVAQNAPR